MVGRPEQFSGVFFMSAVVSYEIGDKVFYAHILWRYDPKAKAWHFLNFPFGYCSLPLELRFTGLTDAHKD